jgi:hypothetical protein
VSIALPANLTPGNYTITIIPSDGSVAHKVIIQVYATDFTISSTTSPVSMRPSTTVQLPLKLASVNMFQGNVTFTVTGQSLGPTGTVDPASVYLTFSGATVNLVITSGNSTGTYTLTVQAISGSDIHTLTIVVNVAQPSGFEAIVSSVIYQNNPTTDLLFALTGLPVAIIIVSKHSRFGKMGRKRQSTRKLSIITRHSRAYRKEDKVLCYSLSSVGPFYKVRDCE